jgi:ribonuclease P protein component
MKPSADEADRLPSPATLGPQERVRRRAEFERIYQHGLKQWSRFMTVFLLRTGGSTSRLGVAATRKLGGAVVRNRAKRISREIYRRHKPKPGLDVVLVPKREFLTAEFDDLERDYAALVSARQDRAPLVRSR